MLVIPSALEAVSRPLKALTERKNADWKIHSGSNLPERRYHGAPTSAERSGWWDHQQLLRPRVRTRTNTRRSWSAMQWLSSYAAKSSDANGPSHVPKSLDELSHVPKCLDERSHVPQSSDVDAPSHVFNSSDVDKLPAVDESSDG
jgi:hypothetical protein